MNTRKTTRNQDDQEMADRRSDINDEMYDQFWRDRQLPGNQEIYDRDSEQSRRRREKYCESIARNIARHTRHGGHPDRGYPDLMGGSQDPTPGSGTRGPQAHPTQERPGASQ